MTAYFVAVRSELTDPEAMKTYSVLANAARAGHPMEPLAAYGRVRTTEGPRVDGAVILKFPTFEAAEAWYDSEAYQAAMAHRLRGAKYITFIIQGLE
jgi:uncharacterized protein (DUF1330 family)